MTTCTARKKYTMTTSAPDEATLVRIAEAQGTRLDSPDAGDAMGRFIELLDAEIDDDGFPATDLTIVHEGHAVTISYDWELFSWDKKF